MSDEEIVLAVMVIDGGPYPQWSFSSENYISHSWIDENTVEVVHRQKRAPNFTEWEAQPARFTVEPHNRHVIAALERWKKEK